MADIIEMMLVPMVIVVAAIVAWRVQLSVMSQRVCWDFIANHEQSMEWLNHSKEAEKRLLKKESREGRPWREWEEFAARWSTGKLTDQEKEDMEAILFWLNRKEFVAIAILNGTMDMGLYAKWWGSDYIDEWRIAQGFVEALRATERGDEALFQYFQYLAKSKKFRKLSQWSEDQ